MYLALEWRRFKSNILAFRIRELPAYVLDHTRGDDNTYLPAKISPAPADKRPVGQVPATAVKKQRTLLFMYIWPRLNCT
jgi:hypothetical protein